MSNPDHPEPSIKLYVENQADAAMRLVSEMMILCGEVIATFGSHNNIPLPYRGQPQSNIDTSAFAHLPEGPVRSAAIVRTMRAAEMNFRNPIRHGVLGLPGYVQFTSPIRRYMDLAAHYQVSSSNYLAIKIFAVALNEIVQHYLLDRTFLNLQLGASYEICMDYLLHCSQASVENLHKIVFVDATV